MKSKIILIIIFISFTFTSCINLVEEIWINKDRSGRVSLRRDSGNIGFLFATLSEYIQPDLLAQITAAPNKYSSKLSNTKGITNVKAVNNLKGGELGVSFTFKDEQALNEAWYSILSVDKKFYHPKIFKIHTHRLKKKNLNKYLINYLEENKHKIKSNEIVRLISYTTTFHLPLAVKKIKNLTSTKLMDENTVVRI
jgi:hypothetical protein